MDENVAAGWQWTQRFASLGFALTFAHGRRPEDMLTGFGVEPAEAEMMALAEAAEEFGPDYPVIRAGAAGDWGFTFEEFGSAGADQAALLALSGGTRLASVLRTADGTSAFTYAENGEVVCAFDPAMPQWRSGSDPDHFAATMAAIGLGTGTDPVVAVLTLVTVELGVRLDGAAVDGPLLSGEAPTGA